jgi:geranylgeranyl diphosphate synthase, type II
MNFDILTKEYKQLIDEKLISYSTFKVNDTRALLEDAMQYSLSAKAKRIRPLLTIATFLMFSKDITKIMPIACAIEMIHTYSLIHDDLPAMDNDDFRRGKPTCHKKFGEDMAILAGDTLNSLAFEIISHELPKYYDDHKTIKAINLLSSTCGVLGMAGGQVMDIKGSKEMQDEVYLKSMHMLKTGALIKASIIIPAILESADDIILFNLTNFGHHLGLLFQIMDDVLDVSGSEKKLGKSINKDKEQDKLTYVQLYGMDGAKKMLRKEAEMALKHLDGITDYDVNPLKGILKFFENRDF